MFGVDKKPEVTVELGEEVVVIRRKGISRPTVAVVLGQEDSGSITRLILDRLVHKPGETQLGCWLMSGALVSVLTQQNAF